MGGFNGAIEGFLGEAVADSGGEWTALIATSAVGASVTATQTFEGGTSQMSATAPVEAEPSSGGGTGAGSSSGSTPPPTPSPTVEAPKVTIKKAPKAKSTATTAKFKFVSNEAGSTFKCKLDKKAFANCTSPKTYKKLKPGKHVFKVKATDAAGSASAVVTRKFTVLE